MRVTAAYKNHILLGCAEAGVGGIAINSVSFVSIQIASCFILRRMAYKFYKKVNCRPLIIRERRHSFFPFHRSFLAVPILVLFYV